MPLLELALPGSTEASFLSLGLRGDLRALVAFSFFSLVFFSAPSLEPPETLPPPPFFPFLTESDAAPAMPLAPEPAGEACPPMTTSPTDPSVFTITLREEEEEEVEVSEAVATEAVGEEDSLEAFLPLGVPKVGAEDEEEGAEGDDDDDDEEEDAAAEKDDAADDELEEDEALESAAGVGCLLGFFGFSDDAAEDKEADDGAP
jgi:hypothetical protein